MILRVYKLQRRFFWAVFILFSFYAQCQVSPPSSIPGLQLWLTGDSVNSTGTIDTCYDLSANANHAYQVAAASKPVSVLSPLNGHKAMRFDGADDYLQFNAINDIRSVIWVMYEDSASTVDYRALLGHSSSYDFYRGGSKMIWDPSFTSGSILSGTTTVNSNVIAGTSTTVPTKFSIITLVTTGNVKADNFSMDRLISGRAWDGDLAELIIYNQPLSNADILALENYLNQKYAPPVNLGPDITVNYGFCDTALKAGSGYSNYLWSTGAISPTINVNKPGAYWVQATNVFGRTSFDTIQVVFPDISFSGNTVICAGASTEWNTNLPSLLYNFSWQDLSTDSSLIINQPGSYYLTVTDTSGCMANSDTVIFTVDSFPLDTGVLNADTLFCGPGTVYSSSSGNQIASFQWSDLSSADSLYVTASGQYWLNSVSVNGCNNYDTIDVVVQPIPAISLGSDTTTCFNQNFVLADTSSNNYNHLWSDTSTGSSLAVVQSGLYWLKVTDSVGCNFTDSIQVAIDSTLFLYTLGPDTSFCAGNYLTVYGSGGTLPLTYLWSDNSVNDTLTVQSGGTYSVTITNGSGCVKEDSINVSISGVAPGVNFAVDTSCLNRASDFTDLSLPPMGNNIVSWYWNFGNGDTSFAQNPQYTFADTGYFNVTLLVTTDSGCSASIIKSVHVFPLPFVNFSVLNNCEASASSFLDMSNGFGYGLASWDWNFNDPAGSNYSSSQNPTHTYSTAGTYSVQLKVKNDYGCVDSTQLPIIIKPKPTAGITSSLACQNNIVIFTDSTTLPSGTTLSLSHWNFGNSSTSSLVNVAYTYTINAVYNVLHVVTASNGCIDSVYKSITVHPEPIANIALGNTCINDSVHFYDSTIISSGTIASRSWDFGNSVTSTLQNPVLLFSSAGTQTVILIVTSDKGCTDKDSAVYTIYPAPTAAFTFSPPYGSAPLTVNFTNNSSGATTWFWDFGDNSQAFSQNPTHVYQDTGTYFINLTSFNAYGCNRSWLDTISVLDSRLDVAVIGLHFTEQNNFLDVTAVIQNKGTIDVSSMELYVQLNNGAYMKENWTGTLNKGAVITYNFSSQLYGNKETDFVCARVLNPNGINDEVSENNDRCTSLDSTRLIVYPMFPNPAENEISIPLNVPRGATLTVEVFDADGRLVFQPIEEFMGKGMQFIRLDLTRIRSGIYCVKIGYQGKVIPLKFMKHTD